MPTGSPTLPLDEKVLVWHLYLAALAGRDIYYDQRYRHNLAMRDILEGDRHACRRASPTATLQEITRYTKLFWINTGPYNNLTARKFVLKLTPTRSSRPLDIAPRNGARFRLAAGRDARAAASTRYAPMFFDPTVDPMVTCKTPGAGRDILGRAPTTCTTASRWRTSRASSSATRSTRAS